MREPNRTGLGWAGLELSPRRAQIVFSAQRRANTIQWEIDAWCGEMVSGVVNVNMV